MIAELNFLRDIVQPFLAFLADASAGLPIIGLLGLLIGRRGHANFCLAASRACLKLVLFLGISGLLLYPLSCYLVLSAMESGFTWLRIFMSLPGMPWFSAWLAWLLGYFLIIAAYLSSGNVNTLTNRFSFSEIKLPTIMLAFAAFCFASSFFLVTWPFAGMPAELSPQRVVVAVLRNAFRHWFTALSVAGALGLVTAPFMLAKIPHTQSEKDNTIRWCSIWAFGAAFPSALTNLGLLLGVLARGHASIFSIPGAYSQVIAISCGTLALFCWIWCFFKKVSSSLAWLAIALLLCKAYAPLINSFFS